MERPHDARNGRLEPTSVSVLYGATGATAPSGSARESALRQAAQTAITVSLVKCIFGNVSLDDDARAKSQIFLI